MQQQPLTSAASMIVLLGFTFGQIGPSSVAEGRNDLWEDAPTEWIAFGGQVVLRIAFPLVSAGNDSGEGMIARSYEANVPHTVPAPRSLPVKHIGRETPQQSVMQLLVQRCHACHSGDHRVLADFDIRDTEALREDGWIDDGAPTAWKLLDYVFDTPEHAPRSRLVSRREINGLIAQAAPKTSTPATNTPKTNTKTQEELPSLLEIATTEKRCSKFVQWAKVTGVWYELRGAGPYTIFAPTNEAIESLPPDFLAFLERKENRRTLLKDLLVNHGVAARYDLKQLGESASVNSILRVPHPLPLDSQGDQFVGRAKVVEGDIQASNGIVHLIDQVLLPPGYPPPEFGPIPFPGPGGLWMVEIPAGEFSMGGNLDRNQPNPVPRRLTRVSGFHISQHEVTEDAFSSLMRQELDIKFPERRQDHHTLPAENVTWYQAVEFCNRISEIDGLTPYYDIERDGDEVTVRVPDRDGTGYRLPTEAEWEYACRAGSSSRFFFGNNPDQLLNYAVYDANAEVDGGWVVSNVGSKSPNRFGLYDMYGNVAEWCFDWHAPFKGGSLVIDPQGPPKPEQQPAKVVRGGYYMSSAENLGSSRRGSPRPANGGYHAVGFRVARNLDQAEKGASFSSTE